MVIFLGKWLKIWWKMVKNGKNMLERLLEMVENDCLWTISPKKLGLSTGVFTICRTWLLLVIAYQDVCFR